MKSVTVFFLFLLIGFFTVLLYGKWSQEQIIQKAKKTVDVTSEKIPFAIETAPKKSLRAEIVEMTGDVYWESRSASSPALLEQSVLLQQGELLETAENARMTIVFPEVAEIQIAENAKLSLIQTLPTNLVFGQNAGVVIYESSKDSPISVRSLGLLTVLEKGKMTVTVNNEDGTVAVIVQEGSASVAFNDLENIVLKTSLDEGQEYFFDVATRTGEILE